MKASLYLFLSPSPQAQRVGSGVAGAFTPPDPPTRGQRKDSLSLTEQP